MKSNTIDQIVRSALSDCGYPIHWYVDFLGYAIECLRELEFDTMRSVKSKRITINQTTKAGQLPCDYVDHIRVGSELGQYLDPYVEKDTLNRLKKYDSNGQVTGYSDVESINGILPDNFEGFWATNYINDKGEHKGRIFSHKPAFRNCFLVIRERNQIQLDIGYIGTTITMDYITNGLTIDASNSVHPYAIKTIKEYCFWQYKRHNRKYNNQDRELAKQEFYNHLRILRGRLNPMGDQEIIASIASGYGASIKN